MPTFVRTRGAALSPTCRPRYSTKCPAAMALGSKILTAAPGSSLDTSRHLGPRLLLELVRHPFAVVTVSTGNATLRELLTPSH